VSADVTELAMSFDQAHDWITTSVDVGELAGRGRRAVAALLVELERRDQIIQSQAAALSEAQAVQDRARGIVADATQVIEDQRRQITELEESLSAMTSAQVRARP